MDYFLNTGKGLDAASVAFDAGVYHGTFAVLGDSTLDLLRNQLDFFVQDGIRVMPNLKATIGLRFALNHLPSSSDGSFEQDYNEAVQQLISEQVNMECERSEGDSPGCTVVGAVSKAFPPAFFDAFGVSSFTVDGRLGLAWSPGGSRKTSIRAGWGIYTGQFPAIIVDEVRNVFPRRVSMSYQLFPFNPEVLQGDLGLRPENISLQNLAEWMFSVGNRSWPWSWDLDVSEPGNLKIPRSMQFAATVEREILRGTVASVGYVGTFADNLLRANRRLEVVVPVNQFEEVLEPARPFLPREPEDVRLSRSTLESTASSSYHSLQADIRGTHQQLGLTYGAAFTWSHSIDDASDFFDLAGGPALPN